MVGFISLFNKKQEYWKTFFIIMKIYEKPRLKGITPCMHSYQGPWDREIEAKNLE